MAQHYDSLVKYVMLEHSQEFAEFTGGYHAKVSFFQLYIQEAKEAARKQGLEQGLEQGEKRGTIENIVALLGIQFETDAVEALKPALESIDDLQDLRQLLLAVPQSDSLETFMKSLSR